MRIRPTADRLLFVLSVTAVGFFVVVAVAALIFGHDLENYEGPLVLPALLFGRGEVIYGREVALNPPYLFSPYGPVYYAITGLALRVTGPSYLPGRIVSIAATIATGWLLFRSIAPKDRTAALIAVGAFAIAPTVIPWGAQMRCDALGGALSAATLVVLLSQHRWRFAVAGVFVALAFLVKSTFLAAGAVAMCTVLLQRDLRVFLEHGAGILVTCGLVALGLWATGNHGYLYNLLATGGTDYGLGTPIRLIRTAVSQPAVVLLLLFAALRIVRQPLSPVSLFVMISVLLGTITSSHSGAEMNHFTEAGVALSFAAGLELADRFAPGDAADLWPRGVSVLLLALGLFITGTSALPRHTLGPAEKARLNEVVRAQLEETVPAGEPVVTEYGALVLQADRTIYFCDAYYYVFGPPELRKVFLDAVRSGEIAAFVSRGGADVPGYVVVPHERYPVKWSKYPGPILEVRAAESEP